MSIKKNIYFLIVLCSFVFTTKSQAQFISEVLEYYPAPGQFINSSPWGTPQSANSIIGTINGSLSLGAFGGYVVFKFENPVRNHPENPYGVDFTIFGNPSNNWSEPGIVYVMKDENENGLPDDTWYELAGSDYFFSTTKKDYQVNYFNPYSSTAADVMWTDNYGYTGTIYTNGINLQPYYPMSDLFPFIDNDNYILNGTVIEGKLDLTNSSNLKSFKRAFGYADNQFRGTAPYTLPDNPYTNEKENAGGDAFDIDWAVDENGNYVELDFIHFVKVQTAMATNAGRLGELSTEITGAVIVEPNSSVTGLLELVVIKDLPDTITEYNYPLEAFAFYKGRLQPNKDIIWSCSSPEVNIVDNKLVFGVCGKLPVTLTASLKDNPEISATASTVIHKDCGGINSVDNKQLAIYPNPAKDFIRINIEDQAKIIIYDIYGKIVLEQNNYYQNNNINIKDFSSGLYVVVAVQNNKVFRNKLIVTK
ncbi:MAG: T9SS type A sorting domain-containing protein [Bacteroidales bacterium]|nr:T9SS type A sorting domain-containing protein [Bacteroidales bacterium]